MLGAAARINMGKSVKMLKSERSKMLLVGVAVAALSAGIFMSGSARGAGAAPAQYSPAERAAIEAIVRDYILTHPEIIPEAINGMQAREVSKLLASNRAEIEKPFAGAVAGNPNGDTTLVVFFDYACPYCRASHADVTKLIATDKNLRVVFREFPVLGPASDEAALASLTTAQQNRYMAFNDAMFAAEGRPTHEHIIATMRASELNEIAAAKTMQSAAVKAEIDKNLELGRALGLTGTPSYVIGDQILGGAVGYEALAKAVAEARASAAKRQG